MKNMKLTVAILTAAAITIPFCGCSDKGDSSSKKPNLVYYDSTNVYTEPAAAVDSADKEAQESAQILEGKASDEAVTLNGCDVKIKRVVSLGERKADDFHSEDAEMFAAELEVTNNTGDVISVSALGDITVSVDGSKTVSGMDLTSELAAGKQIDGYKSFDFDINAGNTGSGYTTFDAPIGWQEITISYAPKTGDNKYDRIVYKITPDDVE